MFWRSKCICILLCVLTAVLNIFGGGRAYGVGATVPFTTFEGEAGTLGGGASVVALTSSPTTQYASPQLEASGHAYVQLTATGQYVQWTNNTTQSFTAINLRSCIPDAPTGGGITSTIDLYVNGVLRQALSVNSQQNYCYEGKNYNDQTDKNPADGDPRNFWNDTHAFISGAPVAPGQTIRIQMDSTNTAAFYYVDCVDLETPPAALSQPANSLSITSYGAVAGNSSIDNTSAINSCFTAAQSQSKIAWIPPGIFYINADKGGLKATGITIQGAGAWYSTLYRWTPANNSQGVCNIISTKGCTMKNLSLDCNSNSRNGANNNGAVNFSGSNWLVDSCWVQHVTSGFWCGGDGGTIQNCRVLDTWADGMNLNNVEDSRGIGTNLTAQNNFVRGSGDDAMAINSVNYNGTTFYTQMSNITMQNNTSIAPWGGKGLGMYGGDNVVATNCYMSDTARYIGLGVMRFGVNGSDLTSGTVSGNVVERCGGNAYLQQQAAMMIGNGGDGQDVGQVENVLVENNTIENALYNGISFTSGHAITFQLNSILTPSLNAIKIGSNRIGFCTLDANTVSGLGTGQSEFVTSSGATYTISNWEEGEFLPVNQISTGITNSIITSSSFSNGEAAYVNSNAVGNFVTYLIPLIQAGPYRVFVGTKMHSSRGIWQLAVAKVGAGFTNQGNPVDAYAATDTFTNFDMGTWSPASTSDKLFRFTITGKNAASSGYDAAFDYFALVPLQATTYEPEYLPETNSSGMTITVETDSAAYDHAWSHVTPTATGQSITYTVEDNLVLNETYNVTIGMNVGPARGIYQLSVNGVNIGAPVDEYSATAGYTTVNLGSFTANANGSQPFKFTCTGKNASSSSLELGFDRIVLTAQ